MTSIPWRMICIGVVWSTLVGFLHYRSSAWVLRRLGDSSAYIALQHRPRRHTLSLSSALFSIFFPGGRSSPFPLSHTNPWHYSIISVAVGLVFYSLAALVCIVGLLFFGGLAYLYDGFIVSRFEIIPFFFLFEYCGMIALCMAMISCLPLYPFHGFTLLSQWKIFGWQTRRRISLVITLLLLFVSFWYSSVILGLFFQISSILFDIVYIMMSQLFY